MKRRLFSTDQRLRNVERYLIFFSIFMLSFIVLLEPKRILEKYGESRLFIMIIIFFISYLFMFIYLGFIIVAASVDLAYQLEDFILRNKSWISYPLTAFVILFVTVTASLFLRYNLGIEWKDILQPILIGLIIVLVSKAPKVYTWIKKRLEQKQLKEWD